MQYGATKLANYRTIAFGEIPFSGREERLSSSEISPISLIYLLRLIYPGAITKWAKIKKRKVKYLHRDTDTERIAP
jgi:hypothetical protein